MNTLIEIACFPNIRKYRQTNNTKDKNGRYYPATEIYPIPFSGILQIDNDARIYQLIMHGSLSIINSGTGGLNDTIGFTQR